MNIVRTLAIWIAVYFVVGGTAVAQESKWPINLEKGTAVLLKIPLAAISFEKRSVWSGAMSYTVDIEQLENGKYSVSGNSDWQDIGWPSALNVTIAKAEKKKGYTQVELKDAPGNHIKLQFGTSVKNIDAALLALVYPGSRSSFEASEYYQKEVADRFLPRIFTGPLAAIPRESQLALLKGANYDINTIGTETYKGRFYMVVRGTGTDVYNTIQLNQPARIARAIEKDVLPGIKLVSKLLSLVPGIDGLKAELKVGYKNFVTEEYLNPSYDDLHIYVTREVARKLAEDDITSQQFINESIVLVNGTRVEVSLTQFK